MTARLVEFDTGITKDNKPYYKMGVIGKFQYFGKIKTKIVDISLTLDEYEKYSKSKEGDILNLDVLFPLPQFPLVLTKK